jgi:MerR family transcriptional regulator, light-induced transcriptional regulator
MNRSEGWRALRIGELSRRLGVSDHVLRAWESRYGLLQPTRSAGGFRLYSEADELRVRRMQAHLARGLSAAEAARAVLGEDDPPRAEASGAEPDRAPATASELPGALRQALDAFDEPAAQAILDRLMSDLSLPALLKDYVVPYLAELGERWQRGTASVAQEHFASNVIRGRLAGLAQGWGSGPGPHAILACLPGELHDLALMVFGIMLNRNGWRIDYLGMSTPGRGTYPDSRPDAPRPRRPSRHLAREPRAPHNAAHRARPARPLALAGPGATPQIASAVGARLLAGDPVTEAENVGWPR